VFRFAVFVASALGRAAMTAASALLPSAPSSSALLPSVPLSSVPLSSAGPLALDGTRR
jgi:hypothetical protein